MKSFLGAVVCSVMMLPIPSYIVERMSAPAPVDMPAWCAVSETDGVRLNYAQSIIVGEIHENGDIVPCVWLDRKPAV